MQRGCLAGCAAVGCVALVAIVVLVARSWLNTEERGRSRELATIASGRVYAGMPLDAAASVLRSTDGFWHQAICFRQPDASGQLAITQTMFFYGSHDPSRSGIVLLFVTGPSGSEVIDRTATPDPDDGPGIYRYCLDRDPPT
jgi:hypothetical protein